MHPKYDSGHLCSNQPLRDVCTSLWTFLQGRRCQLSSAVKRHLASCEALPCAASASSEVAAEHLKCVANSLRWKACPQRKVNAELARLCLLFTLSVCNCRCNFGGRPASVSASVVRPVNGAERNECVCVPTSTKSPSAAFVSLTCSQNSFGSGLFPVPFHPSTFN